MPLEIEALKIWESGVEITLQANLKVSAGSLSRLVALFAERFLMVSSTILQFICLNLKEFGFSIRTSTEPSHRASQVCLTDCVGHCASMAWYKIVMQRSPITI